MSHSNVAFIALEHYADSRPKNQIPKAFLISSLPSLHFLEHYVDFMLRNGTSKALLAVPK